MLIIFFLGGKYLTQSLDWLTKWVVHPQFTSNWKTIEKRPIQSDNNSHAGNWNKGKNMNHKINHKHDKPIYTPITSAKIKSFLPL